MKRLIAVLVLLVMTPAGALAQNSDSPNADHPPRGMGYGFVAGGSEGMSPYAGLGGEVRVANGFGVGAEIGATSLTGDANKTTGLGSLDLLYHHFPKKLRGNVAPFLAGGYTAFFGHNTHEGTGFGDHKPLMTEGFNVGGGIDVFATKHIGVRLDLRYYGHGGRILNYVYPNLQQFSFVAFRVGVTFH